MTSAETIAVGHLGGPSIPNSDRSLTINELFLDQNWTKCAKLGQIMFVLTFRY